MLEPVPHGGLDSFSYHMCNFNIPLNVWSPYSIYHLPSNSLIIYTALSRSIRYISHGILLENILSVTLTYIHVIFDCFRYFISSSFMLYPAGRRNEIFKKIKFLRTSKSFVLLLERENIVPPSGNRTQNRRVYSQTLCRKNLIKKS